MNHRPQQGFSLIEIVLIIVLLGVGAAAMVGMFSNVGRTLGDNQGMQTGAQLVQKCAEHIMAFRRSTLASQGYANVTIGNNTGICDASFSAVGGFTSAPVVNVTAHDSSSLAACPSATAGDCKQVDITISKSGVTMASTTLMLVNY